MRIRKIGAALAASLCLLATGCGAETEMSAAQILTNVRGNVSDNRSVRATIETTIENEPGTMRMEMAARLGENPAMSMSMTMPEGLTGTGSAGTMETRLVDGVMYVDMSAMAAMASEVPGGFPGFDPARPWVKVDLRAMGGQGREFADLMDGSLGAQDPAAQIAMLQQAGDLRKTGSEIVNGVKATRFTGTVDLTRLAQLQADALGLTQSQLDRFRESMEDFTGNPAEVELWVDGKNLPVRMIMRMREPETGLMTIRCDYHGWGQPVEVTAPPADRVRDMGEVPGFGFGDDEAPAGGEPGDRAPVFGGPAVR